MTMGADPGKVIQVLASQIGELNRQLAVSAVIIEEQDQEVSRLKAQQAERSDEISN